MGGERIFTKLRASLFNDDLSNEPKFGRIHLAGHSDRTFLQSWKGDQSSDFYGRLPVQKVDLLYLI